MRVLVTCPPMLGMKDEFMPLFEARGIEVLAPDVVQELSEDALMGLVSAVDGWIIGDDPASRRVLEAGRSGRLKAAVKWGVGVDNVDFAACSDLGIRIANTPGMFGREVADLAVGYLIALARETFQIDRGVRDGLWPKPRGISLAGKSVGLIGLGDIGRNISRRLDAAEMRLIGYDPAVSLKNLEPAVSLSAWPERLGECDFLILCCALTEQNRHLLNASVLAQCKAGVRVVNVARGPLIDEAALSDALASGKVSSAAFDVFEVEPLPADSPLRRFPQCIFGSHNASNTTDAVRRASAKAIELLLEFLQDEA